MGERKVLDLVDLFGRENYNLAHARDEEGYTFHGYRHGNMGPRKTVPFSEVQIPFCSRVSSAKKGKSARKLDYALLPEEDDLERLQELIDFEGD